MLISVLFVGIEVFLYLEARLILLPAEGVMMVLKEKTIFELHNIKIGFFVAAVLVGKAVGMIPKFMKKEVEKLKVIDVRV